MPRTVTLAITLPDPPSRLYAMYLNPREHAAFTGAPVGPARTGADVYLDPGSLRNAVSGKPEDLAERLAGARAVHIAGWNADNQDPKFDYDYPRMRESGYAWPIVDMRLKYVRPAEFGQRLLVRTEIVEWENRLRISYRIRDAVSGRDRVLIVDDVLATGGTAQAAAKLVRNHGAQVVGFTFLIELDFLNGRERLKNEGIEALLHYA